MAATDETTPLYAVFTKGRVYNLAKGQIINVFDDDYLYLLHDGFIKRYLITREGESAVQSVYGQGQIFPLTAVMSHLFDKDISNEHKTYYYQTISAVHMARIPMVVLDMALETQPLLYRALLAEAGNRLRSNIQLLDNQSLRNVRWRLAHQLVYLAGQFGEPTSEGAVSISLPITQADLGSMLNIARETVSRNVAHLQAQEYLRIHNKQFIIPSVDKLRSIYS